MHELHELKEKLLRELEEYGTKELSAGTLDVVDKLSHAIKNICKIIDMYEEDGEYSGDYMRPYMGGVSYARGRRGNVKRDAMGRYSSERGYSRDMYSRDGKELARQIRDLMDDAPDEHIRRDMEKLLHKVEQM